MQNILILFFKGKRVSFWEADLTSHLDTHLEFPSLQPHPVTVGNSRNPVLALALREARQPRAAAATQLPGRGMEAADAQLALHCLAFRPKIQPQMLHRSAL